MQTLSFSLLLVWWETAPPSGASDLILAVVTACFAYIGYAISSLTIFFLTSPEPVDFASSAADTRVHLMFLLAFAVNVVFSYIMARKWRVGTIMLSQIFLIAWLLDSGVIWVYQKPVFGGSSLHMAGWIGSPPAAIIALSIRWKVKKPDPVSG